MPGLQRRVSATLPDRASSQSPCTPYPRRGREPVRGSAVPSAPDPPKACDGFPQKMATPASLCRPLLISFEGRFLLLDERMVGAMKIVGCHANRLRLCFGFDGLIDSHVPFLVQ